MSKILHFYIVISDCELTDVIKPKDYEVYDSLSRLGFVIVDIEKFDNFISSRAQGNDLIDLFTTTELANEIFDEGMMILCWGSYPWLYYINSIQFNSIQFNQLMIRLVLERIPVIRGIINLNNALKMSVLYRETN